MNTFVSLRLRQLVHEVIHRALFLYRFEVCIPMACTCRIEKVKDRLIDRELIAGL